MTSGGGAYWYACWHHGVAGGCWSGQGPLLDWISPVGLMGSCVDRHLLVAELVCSADGSDVLGRPCGPFGYGLSLLLGASFCLRPHYTFSSSC